MAKDSHARVICPYYRGEMQGCIRCESPVRAINLNLRMRSQKALEAHRNTICGSFYYAQRCAIARLNEEKYEGGS